MDPEHRVYTDRPLWQSVPHDLTVYSTASHLQTASMPGRDTVCLSTLTVHPKPLTQIDHHHRTIQRPARARAPFSCRCRPCFLR